VKRLVWDFETRSASGLKKEGQFKYSLHPTTRATCLAFKVVGEPTVYFLPFHVVNRHWRDQDPRLKKMWEQLINGQFEFTAHNAQFERAIYENVLVARLGWPKIPLRLYRCSMAKASACALPRSLEGAGEAMKLRVQKDKRGLLAMRATMQPTRAYNAWVKTDADIKAGNRVGPKRMNAHSDVCPPMFIEPETHPEVFQTLYTYCKIDVRAEEELDQALPDLNPSEQVLYHYNQRLNWRGVRFDRPVVEKIVSMIESEKKEKTAELDDLTAGLVSKPGAIKSILEFLEIEGVELPNLRAKTIDDALKEFDLEDNTRQLLELRKALSMASTKKYYSFMHRGVGDRVRDILMYHGASTGRESGTGIQVQNFPRGLISKQSAEIALEILTSLPLADAKAQLHFYFGQSLGIVFSALLRNMIIPDQGYEMFVADFSKIEVAVLWWLADNDVGLNMLTSGDDPYVLQAIDNTGKDKSDITSDDRQLGKAQILGGGFGIGWVKFQKTAWDMYRLKLTDDQSKSAVNGYRKLHSAVPSLWREYEKCAVNAIENKGESFTTNKCAFTVEKDFLWVTLPSGRKLAYREPQISWRETDYGPRKTVEFMGLDKSKKKLQLERTWGGVFTENIVQATARDLMMPSMLRLEKAGYQGLMSVHDEGLTQREKGTGSVDKFINIMCEIPPWGKGLPLEANGWVGDRYRKG
jgi:DNA polymerase